MLSKPDKFLPDNLEKIREKLRHDALVKEFKRLQIRLKKKGKIIFFQKIALSITLLLLLGLGGFMFIPAELKTTLKRHVFEFSSSFRSEGSSSTDVPTANKKVLYHVRFKANSEIILASFPHLDLAIDFCLEIKNMGWPETEISKNNTYINTYTRVTERSKYSIQLGAFEHYYLKEFTHFFHDLEHHYGNGLHKYQLGPIRSFAEGKHLAEKLELPEFYLVAIENRTIPPKEQAYKELDQATGGKLISERTYSLSESSLK